MDTIPRYFVLPGQYTSGNSLLIKYDGEEHYWYWGRKDKQWILGTPLIRVHWLDGHLIAVTEEEKKRMIENEDEKTEC
jgi:hypothetical protein